MDEKLVLDAEYSVQGGGLTNCRAAAAWWIAHAGAAAAWWIAYSWCGSLALRFARRRGAQPVRAQMAREQSREEVPIVKGTSRLQRQRLALRPSHRRADALSDQLAVARQPVETRSPVRSREAGVAPSATGDAARGCGGKSTLTRDHDETDKRPVPASQILGAETPRDARRRRTPRRNGSCDGVIESSRPPTRAGQRRQGECVVSESHSGTACRLDHRPSTLRRAPRWRCRSEPRNLRCRHGLRLFCVAEAAPGGSATNAVARSYAFRCE